MTLTRNIPTSIEAGENGPAVLPSLEPQNNSPPVPIAICGMGMRLPGGIRNDLDLYEFLVGKKDARTKVPKNRFNIDAYHNEHGKRGTIASKYGYFLEDVDLTKFDSTMFNMTATEVNRLDPSQRLLLEVVREAFESAGETEFRGKDIGTYTAVYSEDWRDMQDRDSNDRSPYEITGKLDFMLGNRISYEYDLRGPSMTLKTACSSSGVALHQALQAIRLGEISSALVAAANLILGPGLGITMSETGTLSPDGSCKTFDASANGYARAEAVSCLYVKRLDQAIADGNPIRAIIRASASNADGRSHGGLTVPNSMAQEALIRQTYRNAGLDLGMTAMVECHGSGTPMGDPKEVSAIAKCFGEHGVYIGSLKPNLGHSEAASALTAVLKAVVSLESQTILPNIKFVTPNPAIPWENSKLKVPTESLPWPEDRCERLSFILDSSRSFGLPSATEVRTSDLPAETTKRLLLFSSNNAKSLKAAADGHLEYLEKSPGELESLAYTLSKRREHLKVRGFCVTDGLPPFHMISHNKDQSQRLGPIVFVFTGQGAQWANMGRQLLQDYPVFRESIKAMDVILRALEHAPDWTIEDIFLNCETNTELANPGLSQPICTALQIALVDLLASWGVNPSAVIGHSSGEIAAAYAAGALSMKDAFTVAFYRGYICLQLQNRGKMAAVGLGRDDVRPYLVPGVQIACENSGRSVTLSGDIQPLEECMAAIKSDYPDTLVRGLHVDTAYHSHHMQDVGSTYHDLISSHLNPQVPHIPFISSVHGKVLAQAADFAPMYWQENLENPVLFYSAVKRVLQEYPDASIHIEVGPHSALAGPLKQIYTEQEASPLYCSTLLRGKDDAEVFLQTMGELFCAGVKIQPPVSTEAQVLTRLPTFQWNYGQSYWNETRIMARWRHGYHPPHDLLGRRVLETSDLEPTWRNILRIIDVPWLLDHSIGKDVVFPASGYVAMAGEAASQLAENTGVSDGYTVREVHLTSAMLLQEDEGIEVITTLRPKMLTTSLDSTWYEFTIMSHNTSGWTRHCRGLVKQGRACAIPARETKTFSRKISHDRWYKTMARIGLNYGPRFQGLQDITASVVDKVASGRVTDRQEVSESPYPMHPATLDIIFQSWSVAQTNGIHRYVKTLSVPTFIEELYIGCVTSMAIDFNTSGDKKAFSYGVCDGKPVFYLQGLKGTPLESGNPKDEPKMNIQCLQWSPDFDLADATKLMRPAYDGKEQLRLIERLYVLCAAEAKEKLANITPSQPHFACFMAWLDRQVKRFGESGYPLVEDSASLLNLDIETREKLIGDCLEETKSLEVQPVGLAIWRSYQNLAGIIEGQVDFLDLLLQDGLLQQIYDWMNDLQDLSGLFSLLGNARPQLRILEIGAGTGGMTAKILPCLQSEYGERLYLSYTFTDISSGFFVHAQDRFKEYSGIEYKVLDISQDPIEQGFKEAEYDLIIASNVLHATPNLVETLSHCRKLLQLNGYLTMQELSPITKSTNFVMGLFSGWWLGEEDGRVDEPYVSPEEWDIKLREAGFDGVSSVMLDGEKPYHFNANILAQPRNDTNSSRRLTLLIHPKGPGPLARATQVLLNNQGYEINYCTWMENDLPPSQDLISFLDVEGSSSALLQDVGEEELRQFLQIIDTQSQSNILWLSKAAQIDCEDPHHAQILGMARTLRTELGVRFATMELEYTGRSAASAIVGVIQKLQRVQQVHSDLDPDMEYAWKDGVVHIGRFHWHSVHEALANTIPSPEAKHLVVGQCGMLQSLQWRGLVFDAIEPEEVQIQTAAIGMNFKEILCALGLINADVVDRRTGAINTMGYEGAGRITAVGSAVKHLQIGDRVLVMGTSLKSPGFATSVQRLATLCTKIPDCLTDEEAATMPIAYYTILYSLVDKANLQRGQSLLIHSASGGVGIAAIHVARWLGAEIYVTTGTEEKIEFLVREFGVPRERIFNSRDDSFVDGIMNATHGVGVDVVLNSLSGDLLHASWKCVAEYGCMVEIGKRDVIGHGQLAMAHFEANRTFHCIDASKIMFRDQCKTQRMLEQIVELYEQGHIHPIRPIKQFDAVKVEDAFRYMQQGQHMGKIVIKFPEQDTLPLVRTVPEPYLRSDASYLLVGGTGGLGKAIASWMMHCGVRNLIFLSRSAGRSAADKEFFDELREGSCEVQCYAGDVADTELVRRVVSEARFPIAGVMQMAMVLRDVGVMDMDAATWAAAVEPKVNGTWNLHRLLPADLDFFVLFSSMSGLIGYYGQANYASASTFLDAFAQYRQACGLAASTIDIGPIDEVGFVPRLAGVLNGVTSYASLISEQDFLDTLQLAMVPQSRRFQDQNQNQQVSYQCRGQLAMLPRCTLSIADAQNNSLWKRDPRMAIYRNIEKVTAIKCSDDTPDTVRAFVSLLAAEPSRLDDEESSVMLARAIRSRVATFLMNDEEDLDLSQTLSALGVDSLVSIELKNWWRQMFGVDVSVLELMNGGSIQQLGQLAVERLRCKFGAGETN
ncbi:putative polyketide synthase [Mariannaea sp. PMI_226]|nr:putative polyketide synthase [Mariannaea sp. PMI_226]